MRPSLPLTELKIRNLKPKDKIYKEFDGGSPGLYLEILPTGTKSWRVKYQADKIDRRETLGHWPEVGLKRARELAADFRRELREGPSERRKEITFDDLCQEWKDKFYPSLSPKTVSKKNCFFHHYILPHVGRQKINGVSPSSIFETILKPIEREGLRETARRVKTTLSQVLRYGVAIGVVERDCTQDLKGALSPALTRHRAAIIDRAKVGRLILDIANYAGSPSVMFALRILPYVFVRPGELRHAEWGEIDCADRLWRIPAEKMKMRAAHLVPLSDQVLRLLAALRNHTGSQRYLFPGPRTKDRPISDVAINAALRYLGYGKDEICGHGFRTTASTLLNEMGYNSDWIERQLAHVDTKGVRAVYNRAEYLAERRRMMQDWADYLDRLALAAAPGA